MNDIPVEAVSEAVRIAHREGVKGNKYPRLIWLPPITGTQDAAGGWMIEQRFARGGSDDIYD